VEFTCFGATQDWVQERIFGEQMPLPSWWMCERRGDLYFSLDELGFCVQLGEESMLELVREYGEIYGARTVLRKM